MHIIKLNSAKQSAVIHGHPWIFPKAIANNISKIKTGDIVRVLSAQDEFIGMGVFNEFSLYRVRMLSYAHEPISSGDLSEIIEYRFQRALFLRKMLNLPNSETSAYRLFNSEGDGLSGLTIDVYGVIAVISSSSYWVEMNRELIERKILELNHFERVVWLSQAKALKQDGWENEFKSSATESIKTLILENGIQYEIDLNNAQKTGMFLDQRENHHLVQRLSHNKRVLDLYCFIGGFAFSAARGGATSVTAIDSSETAIKIAENTAKLNGFSNIDFQKADARENLHLAKDYDFVILDPPKVVPSRKHLAQGEKYYQHLHQEVFRVMPEGGLLLTCNCSAAMTKENFIYLIHYCANKTNRQIRILGAYGAGPDHPILPYFPEGNYLHAILIEVE